MPADVTCAKLADISVQFSWEPLLLCYSSHGYCVGSQLCAYTRITRSGWMDRVLGWNPWSGCFQCSFCDVKEQVLVNHFV